MKVKLDYGSAGLVVDLPPDCEVIRPADAPCLPDVIGALRQAVRQPVAGPPLADLAREVLRRAAAEGGRAPRVAIAVCDSTRPHPRREVLQVFLEELAAAGAGESGVAQAGGTAEGHAPAESAAATAPPGTKPPADHLDLDITVIIATGTHRADPPELIREMLGEEVIRCCQVHVHDCRQSSDHTPLGVVSPLGDGGDIPVALDRLWVEADLRLSSGLVEPHLFAGFSGGPKLVSPGVASLETVLALHNGRRVGHPSATWGILAGNPAHDAIRAVAETCPPHFTLEVVLDSVKRVTHAFAGLPWSAHARACKVAHRTTMHPVEHRFPLVITTSGGYPLDQNLYQAIKGVSAAERIVADGGTIILAAECRHGLPDPAMYNDLLRPGEDIRLANARILASEQVVPDQWQVQVQARILARARVLVKASGLAAADLALARMEPVEDIEAFVKAARRADPGLPIAVLPHGPYCVPYFAEEILIRS